jgi:thiamine monophosphate synthase
MNYKKELAYYYFPKEFNIDNLKKLAKHRNISIIFGFNDHSQKEFLETIEFCKKWKISFYLINDFKMAIKYGAKGVFLNSDFKRQIFRGITFKNIEVIGSAHNQLEYFLKNRQMCGKLTLSPIFKNIKYSYNKILNVVRFNLICYSWKINLIALGGINSKSLKKISMTRAKGVGFREFIKEL